MGARFERVRTDSGWHGRFVAANNRIVWSTETYGRRRGVDRAINALAFPLARMTDGFVIADVIDVDERTAVTP